ncbi:MAG: hydrogenase maturation protease [Candidatus Hydrogenedentota bacterium]
MAWTLEQWLTQWSQARIVFVGVGHVLRGDDAAGPVLAQALAARGIPHVIDAGSSPERAFGTIARAQPEVVLFMDAVDFGASPGAAAIFDGETITARPGGAGWGATGADLEALRRQVGCEIFLLGIQPQQFDCGAPLSGPTRQAVREILELVQGHSVAAKGTAC